MEDYYATAEFADASATVPLPTPGTTTFGSGATAAVLACQPSWAAELPSANAEDGITQLCDQCVSEGVVFEDGGTTFQAVQNGTATVSAAWIGGSCAALDFTGSSQADSQFKCVGWLQDIIDDCRLFLSSVSQASTYLGSLGSNRSAETDQICPRPYRSGWVGYYVRWHVNRRVYRVGNRRCLHWLVMRK